MDRRIRDQFAPVLVVAFTLAVFTPVSLAGPVPEQHPATGGPHKSGPVQTAPDGTVWVANGPADTVERVDPDAGTAAAFHLPEPSVADHPKGVSVAADGATVWVAAHDSDRVYVLDAGGSLVETVEMPYGSGPYSVALSPAGPDGVQRWALVTLHRSEALAVIDTATLAVTRLAPVFKGPTGIVWSDRVTAWVTHPFVGGEHPHLTRISVDGRPRVTGHISVGAANPRHSSKLNDGVPARNLAEGGYLNFRGHPAVEPDTGTVWLPTQYHNMTEDRLSPDSTIQATLRKLDPDSGAVSQTDKVILTARHVHAPDQGDNGPAWLGYGWDAAFSGAVDMGFFRSGSQWFAAVVGEQSNDVIVLPSDTEPMRSRTDPAAPGLPEVDVGLRPMGIALDPTGGRGFVYNLLSSDLSVIDLTDPARPTEASRIRLAPPRPDDLLADATHRTGAQVFFSSDDPRISANGKVACASCHINGEDDGRTWGFQHLPAGTAGQGHGPRATINLLGLGRTFQPGARHPTYGWGGLHRSGDRDEIQDFEFTFRSPHMGGTGFLGDRANPELGDPNAGLSPELDAMAAYLAAVPPLEKSPFRRSDGTLTEAASRGATFFAGTSPDRSGNAACATCHVPETAFLDHDFHDVGARRPGEEAEIDRLAGCRWCAATPTLVGVWDSAPYTGVYQWPESFTDLLIDFGRVDRPAPHGRIAGLTGRQIRDLADFVRSIDGRMTAAEVRTAADTGAPRVERVRLVGPTRLVIWFSEAIARAGAEDPNGYSLTGPDGSVRVLAATRDTVHGDRVDLTVGPMAVGESYTVAVVGPVTDLADTASSGEANRLDPAAPANSHTFQVPEVVTVTLGASGYEDIRVPVHDASPVGPGLATWSHDRVQIHRNGGTINPGFIRFDWQAGFRQATGVESPESIVTAEIDLDAWMGTVQPLELRRVLQRWSDPETGADWNSNPTGGPTWRDHSHPSGRWNRPGAGALGGSGSVPADYNGEFDLAETVDARVAMAATNEPLTVGGAGITSAYRFWFEHPDLDYGHALRIAESSGSFQSVMFRRHEESMGLHSPVLRIGYRLDAPAPALYLPWVSARSDAARSETTRSFSRIGLPM